MINEILSFSHLPIQSSSNLSSASPLKELYKNESQLSALDCAFILENKDLIGDILSLNPSRIDCHNGLKASQSYQQFEHTLQTCVTKITQKNLIHQLVLLGDTDTVTFFLQSSPYIYDFYPSDGLSCLHFAALGNSLEMLEILLDHGFEVKTQDQWGRTPLHYATINPNKEILAKLLEHGADLFQSDIYGCSPIDFLKYQAIQKSPLEISNTQLYLTMSLTLSTILSALAKHPSFQEWSMISILASCLVPLCEFAFSIQNSSLSNLEKAKRLALFILIQKFTLTQMAFKTYVLTQAMLNTITQLRTSYLFLHLLPYKSLKLSAIHLTQTTLLAFNFFQNYPLHFLKDHLADLLMAQSYFSNPLADLTKREWNDLSNVAFKMFQQVADWFKV